MLNKSLYEQYEKDIYLFKVLNKYVYLFTYLTMKPTSSIVNIPQT
jgi:hypothetical protein